MVSFQIQKFFVDGRNERPFPFADTTSPARCGIALSDHAHVRKAWDDRIRVVDGGSDDGIVVDAEETVYSAHSRELDFLVLE